MIKLALLGTMVFHMEEFCEHAAVSDEIEIVGVFGEGQERVQEMCYRFGIPLKNPEELLAQCNAVALMFRNGGKHLQYAIPFIKKRIPLFIDKPFALSVDDANTIIDLCTEYDCPFAGGSCVKLSDELLALQQKVQSEKMLLSGYCSFDFYDGGEENGGIHFYTHHLIEEMLTVFGSGVQTVTAKREGNRFTAIAAYGDFHVLMNFSISYGQYWAGFFGSESSAMVPFNWEKAKTKQFYQFLHFAQTRVMPQPPEYFLETVKISCALEKSLKIGTTVKV